MFIKLATKLQIFFMIFYLTASRQIPLRWPNPNPPGHIGRQKALQFFAFLVKL